MSEKTVPFIWSCGEDDNYEGILHISISYDKKVASFNFNNLNSDGSEFSILLCRIEIEKLIKVLKEAACLDACKADKEIENLKQAIKKEPLKEVPFDVSGRIRKKIKASEVSMIASQFKQALKKLDVEEFADDITEKAMTKIHEQIEVELQKAISKGKGLTIIYPWGLKQVYFPERKQIKVKIKMDIKGMA